MLYRWLDDSVDENLIEQEFFVSGTQVLLPEIDVKQSTGSWKCYVTVKPDGVVKVIAHFFHLYLQLILRFKKVKKLFGYLSYFKGAML